MDIAQIGFEANTSDLVDAKKALNQLKPATDKAEKAVDNLNDQFDRGAKSAKGFGATLKSASSGLTALAGGLAGGFLGGIAAGGLENAIGSAFRGLMQISDQIEHMNNIATAAGGSVGGVQVLSIALSAAGVEMGEIQTAAKKLNTALGDIAIGSGPGAKLAKAALDQLGLSASQLSAMDVDQRFIAIGDAVKGLGLNASQSAALLDNLGIKSTNMIAALSGGGAVIKDVGDQIDKLGLKLTEVDVQNLAGLDSSFDELGVTGEAAAMKIAAAFAPLVTSAVNEVNKFVATTIREMNVLLDIANRAGQYAYALATPLDTSGIATNEDELISSMRTANILSKTFETLDTNAANATNSMNGMFDAVDNVNIAAMGLAPNLDNILLTTDMFGDTVTGAVPTIESLASGFDKVDVAVTKAGGSTKAAKDGFDVVTEAMRQAYEAAEALRGEIQSSVVDAFKGFFTDLMHGTSAIDALTNALGKLADKLMDMVLDSALNGIIGQLFGGGFGSLGNGIGPGATFGGVQSFLKSANGNAFGSGGVHAFAKGGIVSQPTSFSYAGGAGLMGEAGPEAIMPLHRAANGGLGVAMASNDNYAGKMINLNVVINNNASSDTQASASVGDDGSLIVTIDKMVAANLANQSSQTNRAMQRSFGIKNSTAKR